ncbi:hypothetical protein ABK040_011790 [Willaertia magna]
MSVQKLRDLFDDELLIIFSFLKVPKEINFLIMSLKSKRIYKILISDYIWEYFVKSKNQFLFEKYKISFYSENNYRNSFLQFYKQINDMTIDNIKKRELFVNNFELYLPEKQISFFDLHKLDKEEVKTVKTTLNTCKVVIIGDGGVGKTSFLYRLCRNSFEEDYYYGYFENPCYFFSRDNNSSYASLWDTAGQEVSLNFN